MAELGYRASIVTATLADINISQRAYLFPSVYLAGVPLDYTFADAYFIVKDNFDLFLD